MSINQFNFKVVTEPDYNLIERITNNDFSYMAIDIETYSSDSLEPNGALDCTLSVIRLISLMTETWECPYVIDVKLINNIPYCLKLLNAINKGHESNFILIAQNASYEYTIIYHNFEIKLNYIKDTLTALATLDVANGWKEGIRRGKSLDSIAWHFFGIELDKTLQTSDWFNTLSMAQYEYSSFDVGAPQGIINPFTNEPLISIVIEFYILMQQVCRDELNMLSAFELDQACVPIVAEMEANGLPLNIELCKATSQTLNSIKEKSLQKLCTALGRRLQLDLYTGELIVPSDLQKLLNSNKKLLEILNVKLPKEQKLTDVQMTSLEELLKHLDEDNTEEDIDSIKTELLSETEDIWKTKELISDLLEYKKYFKVGGEVNKYLIAVRPKTSALHSKTNVVGAGTSRTSSGGGNKSINLQSIPNSYIKQDITKSELIGGNKTSEKYKVNISVRTLFGVPHDSEYVWGSFDYASQELRIASAISGDPAMIDVFRLERDNPNLIHPITNEFYANPMCDLHIVAAQKMFRFLEDVPLWELNKASTTLLPDGKVPRKVGKIVNFCVGMDAEALTKQGWRKYGEFTCDDEILTYDINKDCYVWSKPLAINHFKNQETLLLDYKGDHNIASESSISRWSVITTPNHRWWTFLTSSTQDKRKGFKTHKFRTSKDISKNGPRIKMVISSSIEDTEGTVLIESWEDLMVMCVVMYHLDRNNKEVYKGQFIYQEELINLNTILNKIWVSNFKYCDIKTDIKPINPVVFTRLSVNEKKRYNKYGHAEFDKSLVESVFNKYNLDPYNISTWYNFLFKLSKSTLDEMFNIFEDICGIHKVRIRTMSFIDKEVKDFVQLIGILIGYTITDLESSGISSFLYKSTKTINSCKCEGMYISKSQKQDVWCPTTETETWVVRYNNFIGITGNSILYGKSDKSFAKDFNLSLEATQVLIKAYSDGFPKLFKWIEQVGNNSKYEKTIRSAYNRQVFVFEENAKGEDSDNASIRKAVNAIIQTTAGDMMKLALKYIKDDKELWKLLKVCNVVHDKILSWVNDSNCWKYLRAL